MPLGRPPPAQGAWIAGKARKPPPPAIKGKTCLEQKAAKPGQTTQDGRRRRRIGPAEHRPHCRKRSVRRYQAQIEGRGRHRLQRGRRLRSGNDGRYGADAALAMLEVPRARRASLRMWSARLRSACRAPPLGRADRRGCSLGSAARRGRGIVRMVLGDRTLATWWGRKVGGVLAACRYLVRQRTRATPCRRPLADQHGRRYPGQKVRESQATHLNHRAPTPGPVGVARQQGAVANLYFKILRRSRNSVNARKTGA